jgi:hypothetical protein
MLLVLPIFKNRFRDWSTLRKSLLIAWMDEQRHTASPLGGKVRYLWRSRYSSLGSLYDALRYVKVSLIGTAAPMHADISWTKLVLLRLEQRPDSSVLPWLVRCEPDEMRWHPEMSRDQAPR